VHLSGALTRRAGERRMGKKQPRDKAGKWTRPTGGGWVRPEPRDVLPAVPTPQPKPTKRGK
jgi:hypothetical protein